MVKIDDCTNVDLDALAVDHYNALKDGNRDDGYHRTQSLIGRLQAQRELDDQIPDLNRVQFWDYFLDNDFANLSRVIVSRPSELQNLINEINTQFGTSFLSQNNSYLSASLTPFGKIVKRVFSYENYRNTKLPALCFKEYNINYCTYCNKEEVQAIEEIDSAGDVLNKRLYQIDHFYPRSRYPFLSLSFFNLIPGCANCNATLKGEKDFCINTHFNPFDKRFDDYFKFYVNTIIPKSSNELLIGLENTEDHSESTIVDFKIIERYNVEPTKEIIYEMIDLFRYRSKKIQKSILKQIFGLASSVEHSNRQLLKSQGVPLDSNFINKKQYGKLKRDICDQLSILQ